MSEESNYWKELTRKRLSRRTLLRHGAFAGLGLAVGGSVLGCGSQAQNSSTPTAGAKAVATPASQPVATTVPTVAQPQTGGILNGGLSTDIPNLSFISNSTQNLLRSAAPVYNNLVHFDPMDPNKVVNELAEKVEVSPDGKTYTFTIIKGVKFHDGQPMTSADVKFTFDTVIKPPKGVTSRRATTLSMVDGIETTDDYTVRFVLKRPAPAFIPMMAQGWMVVMPKHILQEKGDMQKEAVGTGPFMLKEYIPGVSIELVRNPNYHVKGRPYVDGVKSWVIPDPATRFANFRTGKLNFKVDLSFDDAATAEKEFGDKVVVQREANFIFGSLNFNGKRKPWDDIRVRKAASLVIDRQEGIKIIEKGFGEMGGAMPPSGAWALPKAELEKIPGWGKDIAANRAEAKRLMAEAGYPNGLSATMMTRKDTSYENLSIFLKDQLALIGIDCKIDVQETAAANDMLNKRAFDIVPWNHGYNVDDPDSVYGEFYITGAGYNYSDITSKEVDDLYAKQSATVDPAERKKLAYELEKAALLLFSKIPIYDWKQAVGFGSNVRNYKIHPSPYANLRRQDVWLAKQ